MKTTLFVRNFVWATLLLFGALFTNRTHAADVTNVLGRTGFEEATAGQNSFAGSVTELSFSTLYATNAGVAATPNDTLGQVAAAAIPGNDGPSTASLADANARKTGTKYYVSANRTITRQTEVTFGNVTISGYTNRTISVKVFLGGTVAGNDYEGSGTTLDFVKGVLTFSDATTQILYDSQTTAIDLDTLPFGLLKTNYATLTFSIPDGVTATSVSLKLTSTGNSSQAAESIAYDEIIFAGVSPIAPPLSVTLTSPANGSSANVPAVINLTASANPGSGATVSRVAYYYTNSGSTTFVGSSAAGTTYPVSTASLGLGSYGFFAIVTNSLGATANSLTHVVSLVSPLASLTFLQQPSAQLIGEVIAPEVQVGATNSLGAAVTGLPVTLSLTGGGALGGTVTQNTDGSGIAHFANLTVSTAGAKTLVATNTGSGISGTSASFTITNPPAISVGVGGSGVLTFTTLPPVSQWSTFSNPGAANATRTDAEWTALVNVNAASGITTVLGSQTAAASSGNAYWRSDIGRIATQPTGNAGTLLMATLQNDSGATINLLNVAYEMAETVTLNANEIHRGHRVYYSLTGLASSWNFAGSVTNLALSTNNVSFNLAALGWTAGSPLYIIWADENGVSPDGDWSIDNISFTATAAAASLVFQQQPSEARTGFIIAPEVQVKALDGGANAVSNASVTLSLVGAGTLGGTVTAITDTGGIAHFANLTVSAAGVGNTLVATNLAGAVGVSSTAFNITNPPALTSIAFQVQPSDTLVYGAITPAVTVLAVDENSNPSPGVPITVSLVGVGALGGTLTQTTDGSGVATFNNLTVNAAGAGNTLLATNAGSGFSASSSAFAITLPPPISVGLAGSGIQSFTLRPAVSQWSTFGIPGGSGTRTDADWTSYVNSNAVENITAALGSQAGPGTSGNAYWRSDIGRIATQPTGNAGTLLMATLTNTSGGTISTLDVAYELAETVAGVTGDQTGHRVYFSTTGLSNSWTFAGAVTNVALATNNVNISLTNVGWVANSSLYVIWADENTATGTDGDWSIDNIAFTIGVSAQPVIGAPFYNVGTDQLTLTWSSVPGALYTIENTSTVELPLSWDNLFTNIASGGSATSFVITTPVPGTFYRIRKQ